MRHTAWLPLLALAALACTPTRPDNGDLGAAKDKEQHTEAGHGSQASSASTKQERPEFVWLDDPSLQGLRVIEMGHGMQLRLMGRGDASDLSKLIAKKAQPGPVVVQARINSNIPAGSFKWYEVPNSNALIVLCNPPTIVTSMPKVSPDELIVNDQDLGEQILHKQLDGNLTASQMADSFVQIMQAPNAFIQSHASGKKIQWSESGVMKPVRNMTFMPAAGMTLMLTGGIGSGSNTCAVCAVSTGQGIASDVPNSSAVDVTFTPNNLIIKMYN